MTLKGALDDLRALPPGQTRSPREPRIMPTAWQTLMPRGPAWPRSLSSVIRRLCDALAAFWGFVDGRADDLLDARVLSAIDG